MLVVLKVGGCIHGAYRVFHFLFTRIRKKLRLYVNEVKTIWPSLFPVLLFYVFAVYSTILIVTINAYAYIYIHIDIYKEREKSR